MKTYIKHAGVVFGRLLVSMLAGLLAVLLCKYPIEMLFSPALAAERVLNAFLALVPSVFAFFWLARKQGYKKETFTYWETLPALCGAFAVGLLLTVLTDGAVWFSGLLSGLAEAVVLGNVQLASEEQAQTVLLLTVGFAALADMLLYLPAYLAGVYCGAAARRRDRKELTSQAE